MRVRAPVEVSLWTMQTALIAWPLSFLRRASTASASAPRCQSVGSVSGFKPSLSAIVRQSTANWPVSTINSSSPGDSVLTRAASHAPVPEEGKMMTGFSVLNRGPHGRQQVLAELLEVGAAVIEHLPRHGIEDALRNGRRPRNLQEVAAGVAALVGHRLSLRAVLYALARGSARRRSRPQPSIEAALRGLTFVGKAAAIGRKAKARQARPHVRSGLAAALLSARASPK